MTAESRFDHVVLREFVPTQAEIDAAALAIITAIDEGRAAAIDEAWTAAHIENAARRKEAARAAEWYRASKDGDDIRWDNPDDADDDDDDDDDGRHDYDGGFWVCGRCDGDGHFEGETCSQCMGTGWNHE